jgi:hypothetical protein
MLPWAWADQDAGSVEQVIQFGFARLLFDPHPS